MARSLIFRSVSRVFLYPLSMLSPFIVRQSHKMPTLEFTTVRNQKLSDSKMARRRKEKDGYGALMNDLHRQY